MNEQQIDQLQNYVEKNNIAEEEEKFRYSIGDDKGTYQFTIDGTQLMTWNASAFQRLMDPTYWFDNFTMSTFLAAVKLKYKNPMFTIDTCEMFRQAHLIYDLKTYLPDKKKGEKGLKKDRSDFYKDKDKVCRMMVTERNTMKHIIRCSF